MALAPIATFFSIHDFANAGALTGNAGPLSSAVAPWTNWLVFLWLAGVVGLSLRALGGWYLAQMCDVRIADQTARFGIPETRWAHPASFTWMLGSL